MTGFNILRRQENSTITVNWSSWNVALSAGLFISVACFQLVIIIILVIFINTTFQPDKSGASSLMILYFVIFIAGLAFQFLGSIDGTTRVTLANREKNSMQVAAVGFFNFIGVIYCIIRRDLLIVEIIQVQRFKGCIDQFQEIIKSNPDGQDRLSKIFGLSSSCYFTPVNDNNGNGPFAVNGGERTLEEVSASISSRINSFDIIFPFQVLILIVMIIGTILGLFFASKSYQQYGWSVYMIQGAGRRKKRMINRYHIFLLFLKLNAFFYLSVAAQFLTASFLARKNFPAFDTEAQIIFSAVAAIVCAAVFFIYYSLGYYGFKTANYIYATSFLGILMINFLGSVVVFWQVYFAFPEIFRPTVLWLTSFVVVQIITNSITYGVAILLMLDFKEGLKEVLAQLERKDDEGFSEEARREMRMVAD